MEAELLLVAQDAVVRAETMLPDADGRAVSPLGGAKRSRQSGGAASEKAKEAEGQIVLCNPKKPESEPIAAAARANTKSREVAAANKYSRTAAARPTNEESAETLVSDEACSWLDRAQATQRAVGAQGACRALANSEPIVPVWLWPMPGALPNTIEWSSTAGPPPAGPWDREGEAAPPAGRRTRCPSGTWGPPRSIGPRRGPPWVRWVPALPCRRPKRPKGP